MKITIVDDESVTRQWVRRQIEKLDLRCNVEAVFSNGRQAMDYLSDHETDVLFTDIRMPVMDGLELLRAMRKDGSYKVILSAHDEFRYVQQAMRLGANEFVLKSEITEDELERILRDAALFLERRDGIRIDGKEKMNLRQEEGMRRFLRLDFHEPGKAKEYLWEQNIDLEAGDLAAVSVFFEEPVPRERAMELLRLFFEERKEKFFCFQTGSQEFFTLFNSHGSPAADCWGENLSHLMKVHMGIEAYVGVSLVKSGYDWIPRLCTQAETAAENRRFFGICGSQYFRNIREAGDEEAGRVFNGRIREIWRTLEQRDFSQASRKGLDFFNDLKCGTDLHPAYVLALGKEVLAAYLRELRESIPEEENNPRVREIIMFLGKEYSCFSLFQEEIEGSLCFICGILNRRFRRNRYSPPVREIIQFLEEHYAERISLELLAEREHLSKSYISALFKRETGQRFSEYLQEVRLKHACRILKQSSCSVQKVGELTGFFDTAHFSRVFKEKIGMSPLEYRKNRLPPKITW